MTPLFRQGDTAVYLMFAYARLASILRKAQEERSIDVRAALAPKAQDLLLVGQFEPPERALVFELLQLGDVLQGGEERERAECEREWAGEESEGPKKGDASVLYCVLRSNERVGV